MGITEITINFLEDFEVERSESSAWMNVYGVVIGTLGSGRTDFQIKVELFNMYLSPQRVSDILYDHLENVFEEQRVMELN